MYFYTAFYEDRSEKKRCNMVDKERKRKGEKKKINYIHTLLQEKAKCAK
jgi:hypothetical protein